MSSLLPLLRCDRLKLSGLVVSFALVLLAPVGRAVMVTAADLPLIIQVRSDVDQPFEGLGKADIVEHGKVYALVSIEQVPSLEKLVKPVDEAELLKVMHAELAKRGFTRTTPELKPEIAITVNYGRGWLHNPYMDDMGLVALPSYEPRFEEKLQFANFEKLYIHIKAWEYPQGPQPPDYKPKLLWKTTVLTDSPEDRDFNQFIPKMLAAAGDYFDRKMERIEAEVLEDMPEGRVILRDMKALKDDEADLELESERKMK